MVDLCFTDDAEAETDFLDVFDVVFVGFTDDAAAAITDDNALTAFVIFAVVVAVAASAAAVIDRLIDFCTSDNGDDDILILDACIR